MQTPNSFLFQPQPFWLCFPQKHVWTLAAMHKDPLLLVFSSRVTYTDLINSISFWHTSSCSAYNIKKQKHPVGATIARKHQGAKDQRANLPLKANFHSLCLRDPGSCDSWFAVHVKYCSGKNSLAQQWAQHTILTSVWRVDAVFVLHHCQLNSGHLPFVNSPSIPVQHCFPFLTSGVSSTLSNDLSFFSYFLNVGNAAKQIFCQQVKRRGLISLAKRMRPTADEPSAAYARLWGNRLSVNRRVQKLSK